VTNKDETPYDLARAAFDRMADDHPLARFAAWAHRNFDTHDLLAMGLGGSEEVGELAEALIGLAGAQGRFAAAILKSRQKIRRFDSDDKLRRAVADAVADAAGFMSQACVILRLDFFTLFSATIEEVMKRDWVANPVDGLAGCAACREVGERKYQQCGRCGAKFPHACEACGGHVDAFVECSRHIEEKHL
jgi:hypothetical protein